MHLDGTELDICAQLQEQLPAMSQTEARDNTAATDCDEVINL